MTAATHIEPHNSYRKWTHTLKTSSAEQNNTFIARHEVRYCTQLWHSATGLIDSYDGHLIYSSEIWTFFQEVIVQSRRVACSYTYCDWRVKFYSCRFDWGWWRWRLAALAARTPWLAKALLEKTCIQARLLASQTTAAPAAERFPWRWDATKSCRLEPVE